MPLLVVFLGAWGTYHYANQLGNRKNQYDLKVKIYFECLDITHIYMSEIEEFTKIGEKIQKIDDLIMSQSEKIREESSNEHIKVNEAIDSFNLILHKTEKLRAESSNENRKVNEALDSFKLILPKLEVVCSNDVLDAFLDFVKLTKGETDRFTFLQKQLKLTQAIRRDLMPNERVFFILDPERLGNKSDKDFEGISDDLKSEITKVYEDTKNTKKKHWWQFLR